MRVPTRFFLKTMALAGCLVLSLAVAGCNQQATSDDAARVDELEQQVEALAKGIHRVLCGEEKAHRLGE